MAPPSLHELKEKAFASCTALKHVDLSACTFQTERKSGHLSASAFQDSWVESVVLPRTLRVIERCAFAGCMNLKSISFGEDPMLEEIEYRAFYGSGLESFAAPPKLKKIGAVAFGNCRALKRVSLNRDIEELGLLCFWATTIEDVTIPLQTRMTPQLLGLD